MQFQPTCPPPTAVIGTNAEAAAMQPYKVVITMEDGSKGEHTGIYRSTLDAWEVAADLFPDAKVIDVRVQTLAWRGVQ